MRLEVKIVGSGGQGVVLAGRVLARAVALYDGKHALQTELYGAQVRGGMTSTDVIISDEEVDYPKVLNADYLIALSTRALQTYKGFTKKGGYLIIDKDLVLVSEDIPSQIMVLPLLETAKKVGSELALNMVTLGSFSAISKAVSMEALERAMRDLVRPRFVEVNLKALKEGYELGLKQAEKTL